MRRWLSETWQRDVPWLYLLVFLACLAMFWLGSQFGGHAVRVSEAMDQMPPFSVSLPPTASHVPCPCAPR